MQANQFLSVKQTAEKYPAFTVGALRFMLHNRRSNGFGECVIKIGRRVLIDESKFIRFVRSHRVRPSGMTESGHG